MTYDLIKIEEKYNIKLDITQLDVISSLLNFIESDNKKICLKSPAGCGKTLIINILYDIFQENHKDCIIVTPTNKAKLLFNSDDDFFDKSITIHSLLNLVPNFNILDFNAKSLTFESRNNCIIKDILIFDECSMINDFLYNVICNRYSNSKLIFVGDCAQLSPVKQKHISLTFNNPTLELTKVYRQTDSILYKMLVYLRKKPLYKFKNIEDDTHNIIVCNNIINMINQYSYLFKLKEDFNDNNLIKLITYTNNRITALNNLIRRKIYINDDEYHELEVLTGYDTCDICTDNQCLRIENSKDYVIEKIKQIKILKKDIGIELNAYKLKFYGCYSYVTILSRNNSEENLLILSSHLENLRLQAIKNKSSKLWKDFYKIYNSFLVPFDLYYQDRIIKRKSLDYGYCISVHKSQGSTYSIVMIDMENILRYNTNEELRQLQYVACSRTKGDLIIYKKND